MKKLIVMSLLPLLLYSCTHLYDDGYDDGYDNGYDNGYDDGYAKGKRVGYDDGYDDGYDKAKYCWRCGDYVY